MAIYPIPQFPNSQIPYLLVMLGCHHHEDQTSRVLRHGVGDGRWNGDGKARLFAGRFAGSEGADAPGEGRAAVQSARHSSQRVGGAPDGLWIGDQVSERVFRVDWQTGKVLHEVQTESHNTSGVAVGAGYLWLGANGGVSGRRPPRPARQAVRRSDSGRSEDRKDRQDSPAALGRRRARHHVCPADPDAVGHRH
jgi:hypothetical protein